MNFKILFVSVIINKKKRKKHTHKPKTQTIKREAKIVTERCECSDNMTSNMSINPALMQRHLLTIEKLRDRVRRILKCVINLHIEILVLESNVTQLLDEVKDINADLLEVKRLDTLIETLKNYDGPTICHEWPYPLIFKGTIDQAVVAQSLNSTTSVKSDESLTLTEEIQT